MAREWGKVEREEEKGQNMYKTDLLVKVLKFQSN